MGNVLKSGHPRLDLTVDSSDNQEIKDHTVADNDDNKILVANNDDNKILDAEKCLVDDCPSDKELGKQCQSGIDHKVPTKPRTPRVFMGQLTCKPGDDAYEFRSAQVIIDEKNLRESEKRPLDEDYVVSDGVLVEQLTCEHGEDACQCRSTQVIIDEKNSRESEKHPLDEDYIVSDGVLVEQLTCEPGEDACQDCSTQVIIDEKNSRESEKHPLDEDYIVSDGVLVEQLTYEPGEDACQCGSTQIIDEKNSRESEKHPLDEDYIVSDGVLVEQLTCEPGEDACQDCSTQVIIDEKNSRKSKKRPLEDIYIASNDENGVESPEKRQKNGELKIVTVRGKQASQVHNYPPSQLPQNLQDYISKLNLDAPLLFVAQKLLFVSDIRRDQHRLLLPKSLINTAFFKDYVTDNEMTMLMEGKGVRVSLVDNKMHEYHTLNFAKWNMKSTSNYVLKTAWFDVVKDNKLEEAVLQKDDNELEEAAAPKNRKENVVVVMKEDGKLKVDVVVQVWCYRRKGRLWFALNMLAMTDCNLVGKTKDGRCIVKKLQLD